MPDVVTALRDHLITAGVGRDPDVAGSVPPIWREPRDGTPAPGEGSDPTQTGTDAVVAVYLTGGIPARRFEAWRRIDAIDVHIRARTSPLAKRIARDIRAAVIGTGIAPAVAFTMGGLQVIEALEWRPLQPLPVPQGFSFMTAYLFESYTAAA